MPRVLGKTFVSPLKNQIASLFATANAIDERSVGIVKQLLRKTPTTFDSYNWNTLPYVKLNITLYYFND